MKKYTVLEKKIGETPLEAINLWKQKFSEYQDVRASYAGRLDPMASGKLLIILGEECKKQKKYTGLDKEYEVEILLDVSSDTGDILGNVSYANKNTYPEHLRHIYTREIGVHHLEYPIFSSKTVQGKPLFLHALQGTLKDIDIPTHTERIYRIQDLGSETISSNVLKERVDQLLTYVPRTNEPSKKLGEDFRIDTVRTSWEEMHKHAGEREFCILRVRVACGSGTYMRTLAGRIGSALDTKALALSITRTKIGKYIPIGKRGFWALTYL